MPDITLSCIFLDGSTITASGFFDITSWESQDNKLTMTLFSRSNDWAVVGGSPLDISGTLKKVVISGTTYRVIGDVNIDMQPSEYKNEVMMTSMGSVIRKSTRQPRDVKNVAIFCNATERENLRTLAETF